MTRTLVTLVVGSAAYGFAIGSVHGVRVACWNLAKLPLLLLVTAAICAFAYFAFAVAVAPRMTLRDVTSLSLRTYADLAALLASFAPVSWFLAVTSKRARGASLGEYPFFLGFNVALIAAAGTLALARQAFRLAREHGLPPVRTAAVVGAWLATSLFAGGQCAWYLRPFFCPATIPDPPFMEGLNPDFRGATNFYEAVWHLVSPPR